MGTNEILVFYNDNNKLAHPLVNLKYPELKEFKEIVKKPDKYSVMIWQIKNCLGFSLTGILVTMGVSSVVLGGAMKIVDISVDMSSLAKSSQSEKDLKYQVSHLLSSPEECKKNLSPHRLSGKKAGKGLGSLNRLTLSQKTLLQLPGVFDGRLEVVKMEMTNPTGKASDPQKGLSRRVFSLYYKKTNLKNQESQGGGTKPCSADNTESCYFMQCLLNYQLEESGENPQVTKCEALSCLNVAGGTHPECYTVDTKEDLQIESRVNKGSKINKGRTLVGCGKTSEIPTSHTTAFGWGAGANNTSGLYNTFAGYRAGHSNTTGSKNTFSGYEAGFYNKEASQNTYMGYQAGKGKKQDPNSKTPQGGYNTFFGALAGYSNTRGEGNTFSGYAAGFHNTKGSSNTFVGIAAGYKNEQGRYNTFLGTYTAGRPLTTNKKGAKPGNYTFTTGDHNIFLGACAGYNTRSDKDTKYNIFLGFATGFNNGPAEKSCWANHTAGLKASDALGAGNIFIGDRAGHTTLTTGNYNTFTGSLAGSKTSRGEDNVFLGTEAGFHNTTGSFNTFIGVQSGFNNQGGDSVAPHTLQGGGTGRQNTFFGWQSGYGCGKSHPSPSSYTDYVKPGSKKNTCSDNKGDATSFKNVAIGSRAGYKLKEGEKNVFIGNRAGRRFKKGSYNTILGAQAGRGTDEVTSEDSDFNSFLGARAGHSNLKGNRNTFIGYSAGFYSGGKKDKNKKQKQKRANTFIGPFAGGYNREGRYNIYMGFDVGPKIQIPDALKNRHLSLEEAHAQDPDKAANAGVTRDGDYQLNIGNLLIGKMPTGVKDLKTRLDHLPGAKGNTQPGLLVNGSLCVKASRKDSKNSWEDFLFYGAACENNLNSEIRRLECKTNNLQKIVQAIEEGKTPPSLNPGDSC